GRPRAYRRSWDRLGGCAGRYGRQVQSWPGSAAIRGFGRYRSPRRGRCSRARLRGRTCNRSAQPPGRERSRRPGEGDQQNTMRRCDELASPSPTPDVKGPTEDLEGRMTLAETLQGIREASAKRIPPERAAIMHRATDELRASGIMERVVKVGDALPAFALP